MDIRPVTRALMVIGFVLIGAGGQADTARITVSYICARSRSA
jgi:hypothetical protein